MIIKVDKLCRHPGSLSLSLSLSGESFQTLDCIFQQISLLEGWAGREVPAAIGRKPYLSCVLV